MTGRRGSALLLTHCLCLLVLQALAGSVRDGMQMEAGSDSSVDNRELPTTLKAMETEDAGLNTGSMFNGRRLLLEGEGIVLAAGPLGAVIQYAGTDSEQYASTRTRVLLGKDDDDDDEDEEDEEEDDDDDDDDDGLDVDVKAIVGVHLKQFRGPKGCKKGGKLLRRKSGRPVIVDTPVSSRFAKYVAKNEDFLKRIAYEGTVKRKELNAICKKVAKGKTNFKADLNVDEAKGAPDTGDDITGAKVDHQFGCTITKGPKVKLNPNLKKGVVFALLELGRTNNLIDCKQGVKKCNMWTLLDDEDVGDLTDMYGDGRRLLMVEGTRHLLMKKPAGGDAGKYQPLGDEPKSRSSSVGSDAGGSSVRSVVAAGLSVSESKEDLPPVRSRAAVGTGKCRDDTSAQYQFCTQNYYTLYNWLPRPETAEMKTAKESSNFFAQCCALGDDPTTKPEDIGNLIKKFEQGDPEYVAMKKQWTILSSMSKSGLATLEQKDLPKEAPKGAQDKGPSKGGKGS